MGAVTLKRGDRVKVTLEGEVRSTSTPGRVEEIEVRVEMAGGSSSYLYVNPDDVEKIEPPVEVFKPGDVVRNSANTYALSTEGFVVINRGGEFIRYGDLGRYQLEDFDAHTFRRVDLS